MKVLLVHNIDGDLAGAEIMVRQLRDGLVALGHDVRIMAGDEPRTARAFANYRFRSFSDQSPKRFLLYLCNPSAVLTLRKVLKEFGPDIVHLHNINRLSPFILPLLKRVSTVQTLHDHMSFDPTRPQDLPSFAPYRDAFSRFFITQKGLRYFGERLRMFFARRFDKKYIGLSVACSEWYACAAKESGLFRQVRVLHNGIRLPEFTPIAHPADILFLGRIDHIKGVDVLLRAMSEVVATYPQATLRIAGDGVFRVQSEQLARQLGLTNRQVHFLGHRQHVECMELLKDSGILVVPSLYPDNFPTVCLEAMGIGRPIVASRTGGIPEMIDDAQTGFLVTPGDPHQLAEKLLVLLGDVSQAMAMGKRGRRHAEEAFTAERYVERTLQMYKGLYP